ncbi:MAG: hypothetical protein E6R07_03495 [Nevskiaceae bacterium]|nr:MAG: hypothetical protein E6R07_03495 [Nevskiaceae bacterium]
MRLLTLVRHAKSSWDYAELTDFERPLNARGRRDAPAMAARLRAGSPPDRLVSSPALRAITTARLFAQALDLSEDGIAILPRIYDASLPTLLDVVRELDDASGNVALFGHNPGLSLLALELSADPVLELPTCGIVQLELPARRWREIAPASGRVRWHDWPKKTATPHHAG